MALYKYNSTKEIFRDGRGAPVHLGIYVLKEVAYMACFPGIGPLVRRNEMPRAPQQVAYTHRLKRYCPGHCLSHLSDRNLAGAPHR